MVRRLLWVLEVVVLGASSGWAQTYGPGELYYGGIRLQFSGRVLTTGTCAAATQPVPGVTQIGCQIPEGVAGTIELTATRTPTGAVNVRVESVPLGWPTSLWVPQRDQWVDSRTMVISGWGTVQAQYRFTPPAGSAGQQFTLRFKAGTAGVVGELELRVVFDVVRPVTPTPTEQTPPSGYGPFTGMTDAAGRFEVPIPTVPNTSVIGNLTECTVKPLPGTQVAVTLVPKPGVTAISRADQIGAVRVSSPGYLEAEIVQLMLASSMDMWGRTYTTVHVGTVCLRPTAPPVTPPPGPITGKTDREGKFTVTIGPGFTVTGRLTECTVKPLPNQEFTMTLLSKGEGAGGARDIAGFTFSVPGYAAATVAEFSVFSLFGLTSYGVGDVCLSPLCTLIIRGEVDDGAPHGGPAYPIPRSKVWLFVLEEGDTLPLGPLSLLARRPTAETATNHTNERSFDGTEFRSVETATYEFRLEWGRPCPPRVVVVSLLWYDEGDLLVVSSENMIGERLVPVYLAKVVAMSEDPYLPHHGTAGAAWQKTGLHDYIATVDFSYGRDPLARDAAGVIGVAGRDTSEEWDRNGAAADLFMRNCAHFYFYGYKAMRYFEHLAAELGVELKPVAISAFTAEGTSCSSDDVGFGRMAGGPQVTADSRVFIETADSSPPWGGEKPDNSVWHEMGHYWWLQIYGSYTPYAAPGDGNHRGYDNSNTSDSLEEGFAEFTSVLTCEHYGDPLPPMYRADGHNRNLEVDRQLWGPDREEYAIAGLLWDLHDGGGLETKPLGTISNVIETADHLSLSDVQIFEIFVEAKPRTLKAVHDSLLAIPAYGATDTDGDSLPDVRELFVAHGAFEDTAPTNRRWDGGDEIIGFGGRAGRLKSPPLPQAYLLIRLVDAAGRGVAVDGATMVVHMEFTHPFAYYNYADVRPLWSNRVYFVMPPDFYPVTASITVEVPGLGRSAPLEITAREYWGLFRQAGEAGLDYLLEHTFVLGG